MNLKEDKIPVDKIEATNGAYICFGLISIGLTVIIAGLVVPFGPDKENWKIYVPCVGGMILLTGVLFGKKRENARYIFALAIRNMSFRIALSLFLFLLSLGGAGILIFIIYLMISEGNSVWSIRNIMFGGISMIFAAAFMLFCSWNLLGFAIGKPESIEWVKKTFGIK